MKRHPGHSAAAKGGLRTLAMHQLFAFFNFGLVVTKFSRDDFHSTSNLFLQTGLTLTFSAALAAARPFDATRSVLGLVEGLGRFIGPGGSLDFRCDVPCRKVLYPNEEKDSG